MQEYAESLLKTIAEILAVIMGYRRFWVGSCSVTPSCESFSPLTCLAGKWRTKHSKTFCEAMNFAKFSLRMFKKRISYFSWNISGLSLEWLSVWNEISLLKMKKLNTEEKSFGIFTMQCDKWAIFHIANLLKNIFNRSFQTHFFPKKWHFKQHS